MDEYVFHADRPPVLTSVQEESNDASWKGVADFLDVWIDKKANVTGLIWDYDGVIHQTAPWTELVVIIEGEGDFDIDGKTYALKAGDFVVWPEGLHGVMTTRGRLRTICIAYPFVRSEEDYRVNIVQAPSQD